MGNYGDSRNTPQTPSPRRARVGAGGLAAPVSRPRLRRLMRRSLARTIPRGSPRLHRQALKRAASSSRQQIGLHASHFDGQVTGLAVLQPPTCGIIPAWPPVTPKSLNALSCFGARRPPRVSAQDCVNCVNLSRCGTLRGHGCTRTLPAPAPAQAPADCVRRSCRAVLSKRRSRCTR